MEVGTASAAPDSIPEVDALAGRIRAHGADWVVTVGGGRVIDAAKAARLRAVRPDAPISGPLPLLDLPEPLPIRLAAVPTTSGSGAESTGVVDLVAADGAPVEVAHRALAPEWAFIDPTFAAALPPDVAVDGALETATQALEAYLSAWSNPFSDALATDAFTTVLSRLPHALRWSDDPDARAALHYAASAAGLAASNAQRGVGHALARALVAPTGLSYGRLCAILLPYLLEFDRPAARDRLESIAAAVARGETGPRPTLPARVDRLYENFRVPRSLAAAGVPPDRVDSHRSAIVAHTLRSPAVLANPRVPSARDLELLLDVVRAPGGGAR